MTAVALDDQGRALAVAAPSSGFGPPIAERPSYRSLRAPSRRIIWAAADRRSGWSDGSASIRSTARSSRPAPALHKDEATWALPRGPGARRRTAGWHATLGRDFALLVQEKSSPAVLAESWARHLRHGRPRAWKNARAFASPEVARTWRCSAPGRAEAGNSSALTLRVGDADTARFRTEAVALRGDFDQARLALSKSGTVALSGVCPEEERDAGCTPRGLHQRRRARSSSCRWRAPSRSCPQLWPSTKASGSMPLPVREKDGHALLSVWQRGWKDLGLMSDLSAASELPRAARRQSVALAVPAGDDGRPDPPRRRHDYAHRRCNSAGRDGRTGALGGGWPCTERVFAWQRSVPHGAFSSNRWTEV